MGWFWGASDGDKPTGSSSEDPLRNLDPSLRDFLKKESPIKYSETNPPTKQKPVPQPQTPKPQAPVEGGDSSQGSKVPAQSLYQDGRYAHLWASYQSQTEVEAAAKSDAEKISDVLEGYKYRKAEIGRAALENCALEQGAVNDCFTNGGMKARLTMCRAENKQLERCYTMQARFLKALGYLSVLDRSPDVDEKIQMHADTLYHRMLAQEAAIEKAKEEGTPVPTFPPLLSHSKKEAASERADPMEAEIAQKSAELMSRSEEELSAVVRKQLDERLRGLSEQEKEVEARSIAAELKAGEQVAGQLGSIYQRQEAERRKRKEEGKQTIADHFSGIFGNR